MEYKYVAPPEEAADDWMAHHISIFVKVDNRDSFWEFLERYCGPKGQNWKISDNQERWIWGDEEIDLRFRFKKHAMVVKLQWDEDVRPNNRPWEYLKKLILTSHPLRPVGNPLIGQSSSNGLGRNIQTITWDPIFRPSNWNSPIGGIYSPTTNLEPLSEKAYKKKGSPIVLDLESRIETYWTEGSSEETEHRRSMKIQYLKGRTNGPRSQSAKISGAQATLSIWDEIPPES
jgi:hypothetical protein